ncbi:sarcosine dehydrogenase, mitochondrial-like [Centruroides sculpturatus]|uniref:sarcosine dehydrogenase, mitochondrial-like n=1 Tax=Centruroides sculpturatus TaxID=218467 RepID=UPI000C6E356A|nr:sarcosine dehydrogenase, mitochondrial-like [Centruroides sculpturatus]
MRKDPFHEELLNNGCIFQERLGWERPGWFTRESVAPLKKYDYYGSYGNKRHENYAYEEKLRQDYAFVFPKHHDDIGNECLGCRENVAVFNMSYFGKFYLMGPDAQKAADWIFT